MNGIQIFSRDVIPVYTTDEGNKVVLGRELHEKLGIKTPYNKWFPRMAEYGFIEDEDFSTMDKNVRRADGTQMPQVQTDHIMTLDMAKHIAMIQRSAQGMAIRQKLIDLEKQNAPQTLPVSKELQAIFLLDSRTVQHEQRISALENSMVVNYDQQKTLQQYVNRVVVAALGGKDSPAYGDAHIRGKVYSECNNDLQSWFRVSSRNNIPRKRYDEAVEYISRWKPSTNTAMMIRNVNSQTQMFEGCGA